MKSKVGEDIITHKYIVPTKSRCHSYCGLDHVLASYIPSLYYNRFKISGTWINNVFVPESCLMILPKTHEKFRPSRNPLLVPWRGPASALPGHPGGIRINQSCSCWHVSRKLFKKPLWHLQTCSLSFWSILLFYLLQPSTRTAYLSSLRKTTTTTKSVFSEQ